METELVWSKLCLPICTINISNGSHNYRGMDVWMDGGLQEVFLGLQMVNLAKRGTFTDDLSAKCCVVRAAATVELGGTVRNEK